MGNRAKRILVVRPDRIGDVILSTPVLSAIKRYVPNCELTFMVKPLVASLVRDLNEVDSVMEFDPERVHSGWGGFTRLREEIRDRQFDTAVVLHSLPKIAAAVFAAGVPERVGPLSKPHSFVFFNKGIRQRRSKVEMHEAEYNLSLLAPLGIKAARSEFETKISVSKEVEKSALQWLEQKGWTRDEPLVGIHPGMGGSALNWPIDQYVELIKRLAGEGRQIVVTAGPHERSWTQKFQEALRDVRGKVFFYVGDGARDLDELAALYKNCQVIVAPSTGPLHIAVAMGVPVVSFYPKILVQSQRRWGPYLKDKNRVHVFESDCDETEEISRTEIQGVPVSQALGAVDRFLSH